MKEKVNLKKDLGKRRFELFMRDPLKNEMEMIFRKSRLDNLSNDEKNNLDNLFEELWIRANTKWNCFLFPTWYDKKEADIAKGKVDFACYLSKDERRDPNAMEKASACFVFSSGKITIIDYEKYIKEKLVKRIKRDLERPCQESRHFESAGWIFYYLDGGYDDRDNFYIPVSPDRIPIGIDIGGLTDKDRGRVTEEIWNLIKSKIHERKAKGQKHLPAVGDSKEVGFITSRKIEDEVFEKYLKWYDLHMGKDYNTPKGFNFRTIASHDWLEREYPEKAEEGKRRIAERTKTIKFRSGRERTIKGVVGEPVKGEANVEKGVKLIYQAIHRKAYPSRKKMELFNCPEHGGNCPKECTYLKAKMRDLNKRTLLKSLVTTDKELSAIASDKELQKSEERIDTYFKNKKKLK